MTPGRFYRPQLDVVRFCAFLAVFGHHTLPRTGNHARWLTTAADAMGFGLSLFFVLSAYLITLLLLREREQTGSIHLVPFYKRRMLRIWPLYFLGLTIGVARALQHGVFLQDKTWFLAALFFSGNLVYPGTILMSHLWSISIEEQFYLFFPWICRNLSRRGIVSVALALIVIANATLIHFAHTHVSLDVHVWFNSFVQFEMFAAGILLALFDTRLARLRASGNTLAILGATGLWLCAAGGLHLKTIDTVATSALGLCMGYAMVAAGCCLFIVALQSLQAPAPLVYSGKISYGLYVFHLPLVALLSERLPTYALGVTVSLFVTYAVAALSYRYFETPFLHIKRRLEIVPTMPNQLVAALQK